MTMRQTIKAWVIIALFIPGCTTLSLDDRAYLASPLMGEGGLGNGGVVIAPLTLRLMSPFEKRPLVLGAAQNNCLSCGGR